MTLENEVKIPEQNREIPTAEEKGRECLEVPYPLLYFETVTYEKPADFQTGPTHPFYIRK